ncbi:MAG: hypothetical protein ABIS07_11615 [Dokdonella sp.]
MLIATLCLTGCHTLRPPLELTVTPQGIVGDAADARIGWYCNISMADKTLCRGRADHSRITLHYLGHPPVTMTFATVLLYRSEGRIVGMQLNRSSADTQTLLDTFGDLIENHFDTALTPVLRACGRNDPVTAIGRAQQDVNEAEASICSDAGDTRLTWQFYRSMDDTDSRRSVELTARAPGLKGPDSWWF